MSHSYWTVFKSMIPAEEKPVLPMINTCKTKFQHNIVLAWFHSNSGWPAWFKRKNSDLRNHGALKFEPVQLFLGFSYCECVGIKL
jgi:hypothetical protein